MPRLLITFTLLLLTVPRVSAQIAPADAPAAAPAVLTLNSAVAEAQQNNRQIKISYQNVLFANDEILAARTQRYPQFNVQLTGSGLLTAINVSIPKGVLGNLDGSPNPATNSVITTNPKFSAMSLVQVFQPLTQLYDVHLNVQLLGIGKKISQEQLRQQRQQITNSVKEAYYDLLQTQSALQAANENLKALREVDRTTEQYVEQKTALPYQSPV